jgi:hypothetical protein
MPEEGGRRGINRPGSARARLANGTPEAAQSGRSWLVRPMGGRGAVQPRFLAGDSHLNSIFYSAMKF